MNLVSAKESILASGAGAVVPLSTQWHTGNLIAFSHVDGQTDCLNGLVARTEEGGLAFRYPQAAFARFTLSAPVASHRITNDWFESHTSGGECVRGVLIDAHHLLLEGQWTFHPQGEALASVQKEGKLLIGTAAFFRPELLDSDFEAIAAERLCWLEEKSRPYAGIAPQSRYTFMRAFSQMKGQLCSAEGLIKQAWTTPDRWPHRNMWLWDTAFHAIGWRHIDLPLAQEMIDALLDIQKADGFIPHRVSTHEHSEITQPPVLSLGVRLVFEKSQDIGWLASVYPKLCAYVEWNAANRDSDGGGLLEWFIEQTPECRSGESGMDNSSRFDAAQLLDAPDFNAYQAGEYEILAQFATLLGKADEAARWEARHKALCELINKHLWSDELGIYCDLNPQTGKHTGVLASAGFLPLYCGAASAEQVRRLVEHLDNPQTFGTPFPIPSIAVGNTAEGAAAYSKDMWRGPTWININWLVARGLRRYGYHAEADRLRTATLAELERTCERWGTFFEYFDDRLEVEPPYLLRKLQNVPGKHPYQAIHDYGWSATLYVNWLLERD